MAFGVTTEGFVRKRLADIKPEIEEELRASFGTNINLLPESVFGQLVGIIAERESLLWELAEDVYNSQYPSTSEGQPLRAVGSITGTTPLTPTPSSIIGQLLFGTVGTVIGQNSEISVEGAPTIVFRTQAEVTLVAGNNEVQDITFSLTPDAGSFILSFRGQSTSAIAFNATASTIQAALEGLSSVGTGNVSVTGSITNPTGLTITFLNAGPDGLGLRDVDAITFSSNTLVQGATAVAITVTETTKGVPQGSVNLLATETGPQAAAAGSAKNIDTPIAGWDSTVNPLDATLGVGDETDAEFRIRRDEEVAKSGSATPEAIIADLKAVTGVTNVVVFFNNSNVTDTEGRPSHSVDIVVENGDEDAIAAAIFATVGGGIGFVGDISKTVIDSQGFSNTVRFSRPDGVDIYVELDLTVDGDLYPANGDDQVKAAVVAYGEALGIGTDIVVFGSDPNLSCAFKDVRGILDVTIRVGKVASPTLNDNIEIQPREVSQWDTSRVAIAKTVV